MKECIETCWECRTECEKMLFTHCIEEGGKHTEPDHVRIMMDCIQICQVCADSMTRNSPIHMLICAACAEVCQACAESCEKIGGQKIGGHMQKCAELCRACAQTCREMSHMKRAA